VALNVIVYPRRGEPPERLIKRFIRKCKKERVLEVYKEKTSHYVKPAVKRKIKRKKAIRERQKLERKQNKKLFR